MKTIEQAIKKAFEYGCDNVRIDFRIKDGENICSVGINHKECCSDDKCNGKHSVFWPKDGDLDMVRRGIIIGIGTCVAMFKTADMDEMEEAKEGRRIRKEFYDLLK